MKRIEQRRRRLHSEGFPAWEAKRIAERTEWRLNDPALKELRKDRRTGWRSAKRIGLGRRAFNRQVAFDYRVNEHVDKKGRFRPTSLLGQIGEIPRVIQAQRALRIRRETPTGYEGRVRILMAAQFTSWEARILARMKDIDPSRRRMTFLSQPWQAMIKNHKAFVDRMLVKAAARLRREMGARRYAQLTKAQVMRLAKQKLNSMLRKLYAAGKYDVWAWLKREYRPKKVPRAYVPPSTTRARKRTNKLMETKGKAVMFFD